MNKCSRPLPTVHFVQMTVDWPSVTTMMTCKCSMDGVGTWSSLEYAAQASFCVIERCNESIMLACLMCSLVSLHAVLLLL